MNCPPTPAARCAARCAAAVVASLAALSTAGCNSTIAGPPPPPDPCTVFLLHEALHQGLVLPPSPGEPGRYVEFGFGDWSWFALGNDAWYDVFATVLWPTRGALGRREFDASTPAELVRAANWATLSPIVCSTQKVAELRQRLQAQFDAASAEVVERRDLRFRFVPTAESYWFPNHCADVTARWLEQIGCTVGWAPVRTGLHVAPTAPQGR